MSNECGFKYQVSLKFGEYDNAMLNVRADTETELADACQAAIRQAGNLAILAEAVRATAVVNRSFPGTEVVGTTGNAGTPAATVPAQPAPAAPPVAASPYACPHGSRVKRSGGSGPDAWEGWFCPLDKNHPERCKPLYPGR